MRPTTQFSGQPFFLRMTLCKLILKWLTIVSMTVIIGISITSYLFYVNIIKDLPDVSSLRDAQYQMPFSIYTQDKAFIARFGEKKRTPIRIRKIPQSLINAFLAAEDDRYYSHPGVDYKSLVRASVQLLLTGKKTQGASTITMQVIRNFLLTREKTYARKLKEIILSLQIEETFSKEEILELYLNKIYMGHSAYGIVAAAEVYYGKSNLADLTLAEQAMIAGLPKAPSLYNPITDPERAKERRDYVLQRMATLGYAQPSAVAVALDEPDTAKLHWQKPDISAPYIAEMVRKEMLERYGENAYTSGMKVYTTINKPFQEKASQALRDTLHLYDKRHGISHLPYRTFTNESEFRSIPIVGDTYPALVLKVRAGKTQLRLQNNTQIEIPTSRVQWRKSTYRFVNATLQPNDIIRVRKDETGIWELSRVPNVQGAFACLNPLNGAIVAIEGGFDFYASSYNRATQSKRQPGSGFKPIIYTTALEDDFSVASIIHDAPIVITTGTARDRAWHPQNYSNRYYGPTPIRTALIHSRNIVAIRLLQELGLDKAIATAMRFGFDRRQLPYGLSLALGSGSASPLQMARMYSVFANGGFLVKPHLIEKIEDYKGNIVFQADPDNACPLCVNPAPQGNAPIANGHPAQRIISPEIAFLMNSLLRDVVRRGTATDAKVLERSDIAGKTGTTNDQKDAWFNGFSSYYAATAWVGFDSTKSLGSSETGGKAALPMWINFMRYALQDKPDAPMQQPEGIIKASIYNSDKEITTPTDIPDGRWDYFIRDKVITKHKAVLTHKRTHSSSSSSSTKRKSRSVDNDRNNGNDGGTEAGRTVEQLF